MKCQEACVFKWHKRFKEGREEVEHHLRSGRPSTSRNENIELGNIRVQKVHGKHQLSVHMIANELGISYGRVWKIITEDLRMKKICAKMVTSLLNEDQMEQHV